MKRQIALLLLPVWAFTACEWNVETSEVFNVSATLVSTTCGTGAVDADDTISFQVSLTRDDDALTWYDIDNDLEMEGLIVDDEVTVAASQDFVITETDGEDNGCSVRRRDVYEATLVGEGDDIEQVEGDVTFTFSQVSGTDCDSLIGDSDGFDELPCEVEYEFVAVPDD